MGSSKNDVKCVSAVFLTFDIFEFNKASQANLKKRYSELRKVNRNIRVCHGVIGVCL